MTALNARKLPGRQPRGRLPRWLVLPAMHTWYREAAEKRDDGVLPGDAPEAHASGSDPDRILLWGDSAVMGYGVRSHDLALPGCLARQVSLATGRGADVIATPIRHLTVKSAEALLSTARLATYDAIVVCIGVHDATHLTPVSVWERRMRSFLAAMSTASSATTRIVVMTIGVDDLNRSFRSTLGSVAERHANRLNAASAAVCAEFRGVSILSVPPGRDRADLGVRSAEGYRRLADTISAHLAPQLTVGPAPIRHDRRSNSAREMRNRPQNETARQHALDELQLRSMRRDPALKRIMTRARAAFGTPYALVTVIDHDIEWYAAGGEGRGEYLDRASAFCDHTIRRAEPMIVPDASKDPRFVDNPLVNSPGGIRFYAGFPIESPDGHRIGALCVLDTKPRTMDTATAERLRDLALLVQRELHEHSSSVASVGSTVKR